MAPTVQRVLTTDPQGCPTKIRYNCGYTRPVRKVSNHSEYLEKLSYGLDVTWQPVRGDLTVHL